jgi:hypothetical protein
MSQAAPATAALRHPVVLAALAVEVMNDGWLRHAHPGPITWKLSDIAAVIWFPLFVAALVCVAVRVVRSLRAIRGLRPWAASPGLRPWMVLVASGLTALAFTAINVSEDAARAYAGIAGAIDPFGRAHTYVADPTDLLALLFLPVPVAVGFSVVRPATNPCQESSSCVAITS